MAAMIDDAELLRRYAEEKSEEAFAELVRRHVNFVYACAVRRVGGDAHLAEDVTQQVFTAVAREAAALARREGLSGWLYTTARNAAAQTVRGERRRAVREQQAHSMNELTAASAHDAEWERLRSVIDEAMDELGEEDREAVLERFFEGKSFGEIGAKLRLSENAARMRVERALATLQGRLARRGVTSTAAALGGALAGQAGVAAPAGLAASVTAAVMAGAAGGGLWCANAAMKLIAAAGCAALVIFGVAWFAAGKTGGRDEVSGTNPRAHASQAAAAKERDQAGAEVQAREAAMPDRRSQVATEVRTRAITKDDVEERYGRGKRMVLSGQFEAALAEFLWCFDEGMVAVGGYRGVRVSYLLREMVALGAKYPAALEILQKRRDQAEAIMWTGENQTEAARDFALLNVKLNDDVRTFAAYDRLSFGDARRPQLGGAIFELLAETRRYADAAQGKPFEKMTRVFAEMSKEAAKGADTRLEDLTIILAAKDIEVLAGAGDLAHARELATQVLTFRGSAATRLVLQRHLERAGQAGLLTKEPGT
jgi:RNA polymerase sigma factor (sigma-70 family)